MTTRIWGLKYVRPGTNGREIRLQFLFRYTQWREGVATPDLSEFASEDDKTLEFEAGNRTLSGMIFVWDQTAKPDISVHEQEIERSGYERISAQYLEEAYAQGQVQLTDRLQQEFVEPEDWQDWAFVGDLRIEWIDPYATTGYAYVHLMRVQPETETALPARRAGAQLAQWNEDQQSPLNYEARFLHASWIPQFAIESERTPEHPDRLICSACLDRSTSVYGFTAVPDTTWSYKPSQITDGSLTALATWRNNGGVPQLVVGEHIDPARDRTYAVGYATDDDDRAVAWNAGDPHGSGLALTRVEANGAEWHIEAWVCFEDDTGLQLHFYDVQGADKNAPDHSFALTQVSPDRRTYWQASCFSVVRVQDDEWYVFYAHTIATAARRTVRRRLVDGVYVYEVSVAQAVYAGLDDYAYQRALVTDVKRIDAARWVACLDVELPQSTSEDARLVDQPSDIEMTRFLWSADGIHWRDLCVIALGLQRAAIALDTDSGLVIVANAARTWRAVGTPLTQAAADAAADVELPVSHAQAARAEETRPGTLQLNGSGRVGAPQAWDRVRMQVRYRDGQRVWSDWRTAMTGWLTERNEKQRRGGEQWTWSCMGALGFYAQTQALVDYHFPSGQFRLHDFAYPSLVGFEGLSTVYNDEAHTYENLEVPASLRRCLIMTRRDTRTQRVMALHAQPCTHENFLVMAYWRAGKIDSGVAFLVERANENELASFWSLVWIDNERIQLRQTLGEITDNHEIEPLFIGTRQGLRVELRNGTLYVSGHDDVVGSGQHQLQGWLNASATDTVHALDLTPWLSYPNEYSLGLVSTAADARTDRLPQEAPQIEWFFLKENAPRHYTIGDVARTIGSIAGPSLDKPVSPNGAYDAVNTAAVDALLTDFGAYSHPMLDLEISFRLAASSDTDKETVLWRLERGGEVFVDLRSESVEFYPDHEEQSARYVWHRDLALDALAQTETVRLVIYKDETYRHWLCSLYSELRGPLVTALVSDPDENAKVRVGNQDRNTLALHSRGVGFASIRARVYELAYPTHEYVWEYRRSALDVLRSLISPLSWQLIENADGSVRLQDMTAPVAERVQWDCTRELIQSVETHSEHRYANIVKVTGSEVWAHQMIKTLLQRPAKLLAVDVPYLYTYGACQWLAARLGAYVAGAHRQRILTLHLDAGFNVGDAVWTDGVSQVVKQWSIQFTAPRKTAQAVLTLTTREMQ